jgi:ketosteroid isomerase-like protein
MAAIDVKRLLRGRAIPRIAAMHETLDTTDIPAHLLQLERQRCDALMRGDFDRLRELISADLTHVHTRGNVDGQDSYLHYMRQILEVKDVVRSELRVRVFGNAAVMTGRQLSSSCLRGRDTVVTVESFVTQVWAREADGAWRQVAFQATGLGELPPPIAR